MTKDKGNNIEQVSTSLKYLRGEREIRKRKPDNKRLPNIFEEKKK